MKTSLIALAALAAVASTGASAATIVNGGFETGAPTGSFNTTSTLSGWNVTPAIDHIGTFWQAHSGIASIDLNATSAGTISQDVATIVGTVYQISFWMAGNPTGAPTAKTLDLSATGGANTGYSFNTASTTQQNMGWVNYFYNFTATSANTTVTFASTTTGANGPALDDISIAAVPEPATWGMMILGFGAIGGAMRSRRRSQRLFAAA